MDRPSSLSYEDLLKCARGEMFGIENGKLPSPPMLMFDRITHISDTGGAYGKGEIIAELDIKPDLWFFDCHFTNDPVMPGCLGLDALWQLIGFFLVWQGHQGKGRAIGCKEVKFMGQVLPSAKTVQYKIDISRVMNSRLVMVIGDGTVICDDQVIYKAGELKVGLFGAQ